MALLFVGPCPVTGVQEQVPGEEQTVGKQREKGMWDSLWCEKALLRRWVKGNVSAISVKYHHATRKKRFCLLCPLKRHHLCQRNHQKVCNITSKPFLGHFHLSAWWLKLLWSTNCTKKTWVQDLDGSLLLSPVVRILWHQIPENNPVQQWQRYLAQLIPL